LFLSVLHLGTKAQYTIRGNRPLGPSITLGSSSINQSTHNNRNKPATRTKAHPHSQTKTDQHIRQQTTHPYQQNKRQIRRLVPAEPLVPAVASYQHTHTDQAHTSKPTHITNQSTAQPLEMTLKLPRRPTRRGNPNQPATEGPAVTRRSLPSEGNQTNRSEAKNERHSEQETRNHHTVSNPVPNQYWY
jgi:hypothetical protein